MVSKNLLIKNVVIYDGENNKPVCSNIYIENTKIKIISDSITKSDNIINGRGLTAVPGFIDIHSHSDLALLDNKLIKYKLLQGVTSEVIGNCGLSVAPIRNEHKKQWKSMFSGVWGSPNIKWNWNTFEEYILRIKKSKTVINPVFLTGLGTLRLFINGFSDKPLERKSLIGMGKLLEECIQAGASGMSIGIGYAPNNYARKEEYIHLCKVLAKYNKVLCAHMRDEGDNLLESIDEVVEYGLLTGCRIQISHFKTYGKRNFNKQEKAIDKIERARDRGLDIRFDLYPYTAGSTTLNALIPPEYHSKGIDNLITILQDKNHIEDIERKIMNGIKGWENYAKLTGFDFIYPVGLVSKKYKQFEGESITDIAEKNGIKPVNAICDIIVNENGKASMIMRAMKESNIIKLLKHPLSAVGSDGLYGLKPHPRTTSYTIKFLKDYVIDKKILSFSEAVKKLTSIPAEIMRINQRGKIKEGYFADINLIDLKKLKNRADYKNPFQIPLGINYTIINGKVIK